MSSERVCSLNWFSRWLYLGILLEADDLGHFAVDVPIIRVSTFPRNLGTVSESDCERGLGLIEKADLVRFYTVTGKRYGALWNFGQKLRVAKPKWPLPPPDVVTWQTSGDLTPEKPPSVLVPASFEVENAHEEFSYPDDFELFWSYYPRQAKKGAAWVAWQKLSKAEKTAATERAEWVKGCWQHHDPHKDRASFCPHAATWLNARGWEDSDSAVELAARGR